MGNNSRRNLTTNSFLSITYSSFWATVIIMRVVEFIAALHNHFPAIIIRGLHIHHFMTGFALLLIVLSLEFFAEINSIITAILFGVGLGLVADEFLYWTTGNFNYWSFVNCAGTIFISCVLLMVIFFTIKPISDVPVKKLHIRRDIIYPLILPAIFLYCLFALRAPSTQQRLHNYIETSEALVRS